MTYSVYVITCGTVVASIVTLYLLSRPKDDFPGPKRNPLFGNVKDVSKDDWLAMFSDWRERFGDVVSLQVPGLHILVLSSFKDAEDLLIRRANISSGRADNFLVNKLMDFEWIVLQKSPGEEFNEMRKVFRKVIGAQAMPDFDALVEQEAASFAHQLTGFSGDPFAIVQESVGAFIIKMSYGEEVYNRHGAELVKLNTETLDLFASTMAQVWFVNAVNIARFLPEWLPGLEFHKVARIGKERVMKMRHWAFSLVKQAVDSGDTGFSIVSKYLNEPDMDADLLRDINAMLYFGGVDTTTAALLSFFYMMLTHPEIQHKIQEELDEVVGRGNIPTVASVQSLVYLNAAWKESLRLHPPFPTSIPHLVTTDEVWKGKLVPKGTVVASNIWYMLRDPRLWGEDANDFRPERFISEYANKLPDVSIAFGFGRRICPGRYVAEINGTVYAAAVLSSFSIIPLEGASLPTLVEFSQGQIRRPIKLHYRFVPRK